MENNFLKIKQLIKYCIIINNFKVWLIKNLNKSEENKYNEKFL